MLEAIKTANWLNRNKVEDYARLIAFIYIPGLAFLLLVATERISFPRDSTGTDFQSFWIAAHMWLGEGNPYDFAAFSARQSGSIYAFLYPPPFLVALLPLGFLPYELALLAWVTLGLAAFVLTARHLSPSIWPVIAFPPLLINAAHGQNGAITAALFVAAALNIEKRPFLAGVLLGCLIIKPHLALLFPVAFLAWRRWETITGGLVGAAVCVAVSVAVLGPQPWVEFISKGGEARELLQHNAMLLPKLASLFGIIRAPGGPLWLAYGLQGMAALTAAYCVVKARGDLQFGMAVLATGAVITTPFIYSYDLLILIVPLAWLARDGMERGFKPWIKAIMVATYGVTLIDRTVAMQVGINPAFFVHMLLMAALFCQRR